MKGVLLCTLHHHKQLWWQTTDVADAWKLCEERNGTLKR